MKIFKNMAIFVLIIASNITIQSGWRDILCCCFTTQKENDQSPKNNIVTLQTTTIIQNNQSPTPTPQKTPNSQNIPNNVTLINVISDPQNDNNFLTPPNNSFANFPQNTTVQEGTQNGTVIDSRLLAPRLSNNHELQINAQFVESKNPSPREVIDIPSTFNNLNTQTFEQQMSLNQVFNVLNNPIRIADIISLSELKTAVPQDSLGNSTEGCDNNYQPLQHQPSIVDNNRPIQIVDDFQRSANNLDPLEDDAQYNDQDQHRFQDPNYNYFRHNNDDFVHNNNYVSPQISPRASQQGFDRLPHLLGQERTLSQTLSNALHAHGPSAAQDTNVNQNAQILSSNKIDTYISSESKSSKIDQNPHGAQIFSRNYKYCK